MNKALNQLRLFLCTFSGEDNFIIKNCPKQIQLSFAAIGLFVIVIFIGCLVSATTFTYSLFEENTLVSTPFGLFWAFMIIIIYLLLLYTITPPILPNSYKRNKTINKTIETNRFFTLSMILRMGFMFLLAVIIAQPLNVYFLNKSTEAPIEKFKLEQKARMIIVSDSLLIQNEIRLSKDFESKIKLKSNLNNNNILQEKSLIDLKIASDETFIKKSFILLDSINKIDKKAFLSSRNKTERDSLVDALSFLVDEEINSDYEFLNDVKNLRCSDESLASDFENYKSNLIKVIASKIENYNKLETLLNKSNFYLQRISILLNRNPLSWFITTLISFIFLLPIYLKFIIRNKTGFYDKRELIERRLVVDAYNEFKKNYSIVLSNKVNEYNEKYKTEIANSLLKIKDIKPNKYKFLLAEINSELKDDPINKYEHWADCPFKTQKKINEDKISNGEKELLSLLYPESTD